jgi:hypothetical protein
MTVSSSPNAHRHVMTILIAVSLSKPERETANFQQNFSLLGYNNL